MALTPTYEIVNISGASQQTINLLIGLANEAFRLWANVLAGSAALTVRIIIDDAATQRAEGTWTNGSTLGTAGGFSVVIGAPAYELGTGTNLDGMLPDVTLAFNADYLVNELFLDPTPSTRNDIPIDRTDGLSVMLHEIGHALGFIGRYDAGSDSFVANTNTLYDQRLAITNGNVSFDGPNVRAVYGTAVPLTDNNYNHYGNTNAYPGTSADPLTGLMNGVVYYRGYGYTISDLDLAFLADTGLGTIRDDILNAPLLVALRGGLGNDVITGSGLNNQLFGDEGQDIITGGTGADSLYGGTDNDVLYADIADAVLDGGQGVDRVVFSSSGAYSGTLAGLEALELVGGAGLLLSASLLTNGFAQNLAVSGNGILTVNMDVAGILLTKFFSFTSGISVVINGTSGFDIIKLGNALNTINAGDGTDQLKGGNLVDIINGGDGIDKINGEGGADVLTGGAGNDVFKYGAASDSGLGAAADRITDFAVGSDRLNFSRIDTNAGLAGDQSFAFVGSGAFSGGGAASIRYTNSGADILVQADVNGDGVADMEIILQGLSGSTLSAADFVL